MKPEPEARSAAATTPAALIRPEVLGMSPYHVADSRGMVKLDAMENPYGLPDALREQVARMVAEAPFNRYPDPGCTLLKARLRKAMGVPTEMALLIGNGSDEIIQVLTLAVARPGAVVMGVEPSFVMYRMLAAAAGVRYVGVPLKPDFTFDAQALLNALEEHRPALLWLAYPNNPTGNLFDRQAMDRVIAAVPGIVVVDEAYHAFAGTSYLPELGRNPNLLVMRTLSKLGLAGVRLGFLAGPKQWLDQFDKLRLPYNVNVVSQLLAEALLARSEVLDAQAAAIVGQRGELARSLAMRPGVTVFPSAANFILFRVGGAPAVFEAIKARRVLIKNLAGAHPLLADCLRVTVSTPEENGMFLEALDAALIETQ
ncbi:MAG: histidinol-phosphate transaminase [Betaproteobacteria bacterium]